MFTMIGIIVEFEKECIALGRLEGKYKGCKKIDFPENFEDIC